MEQDLIYVRETKNTVVYAAPEGEEGSMITQQYINKNCLPTPFPKRIMITVKVLSE